MDFVKFPDIENLETAKLTRKDFEKASDLVTPWVVTEKIDGTNFSVNISCDDIVLGKRTSLLGKGFNFFKIEDNFKKIEDYFLKIQKNTDWKAIKQITIYGEYFGTKVMPRIYYGCTYDFRFFAMYTISSDDELRWFSFFELENFLSSYKMKHLIVPIVGIYQTFDDACKVPNDCITHFQTETHKDKMEGVVIEPYKVCPVNRYNNFKFKNKNKDFSEKTTRSNVQKHCETVEEKEMKRIKEEFKTYCTESRMFGIFSKYGVPASDKENGKFIGAFIADAQKDFLKDNPQYNLTEKELKFISNIGNIGYMLLVEVKAKIENNNVR